MKIIHVQAVPKKQCVELNLQSYTFIQGVVPDEPLVHMYSVERVVGDTCVE